MVNQRTSVLIIEDDIQIASYIADVIQAFFHLPVISAASAAEARRAFASNQDRIAAVLSDLGIPGANGVDLVKELVADKPEIGIIFATGYTPTEKELSAKVGRPISLLLKPFTPVELMAALEITLPSAARAVVLA
jgi:DNA-binding NtrC family response regulator